MEIILSSSKRGYGLKELMNASGDEYWNSDDALPHSIVISFCKKTYVHSINLHLSYSKDESYTPEKVALYYRRANKEMTKASNAESADKRKGRTTICNSSFHPSCTSVVEKEGDYKTRMFTFKEPEGEVPLLVDDFVFDIHIVILNNHSDGKDSHVRQLRVTSSPDEAILYSLDKFY